MTTEQKIAVTKALCIWSIFNSLLAMAFSVWAFVR